MSVLPIWPSVESHRNYFEMLIGRLRAVVAHLRAQLPATALLLTGLLPRGFEGDHTGQWQTRRPGVDDSNWPNPFAEVRLARCG